MTRFTGLVLEPVHEEEGGAPAPVEQATFQTYVREQDWAYNHMPFRPDLWRWKTSEATLHEQSARVAEAIKLCAQETFYEINMTTGSEDFSEVFFLGSTRPGAQPTEEVEIEGPFSREHSPGWPKVHIPEGAKATGGSGTFLVIDGPTGRSIQPDSLAARAAGKRKCSFAGVHNLNAQGVGYDHNGSENTAALTWAPETLGEPARSAGGRSEELSGLSSSQIADSQLAIRFTNLVRASTNWEDAIPHALACFVQGRRFNAKAGLAPNDGSCKYGYGIPVKPLDGRLPYIYPAHRGEVTENGCTEAAYKAYAPPNGCWFKLNWTKAQVESFPAPPWVKAVYWALVKYGAFVQDTAGSVGMNFRWESPLSYTYRGDSYATQWLEEHQDSTWLKKKSAGFWRADITGSGLMTKQIFEAIQVLAPPAKPGDLPS